MMRSLSNDLSQRARFLAKRDGYWHEMFDGSSTTRVLRVAGMVIYIDEDNTLSVFHERFKGTSVKETILMEGPTGSLIESSKDEVLERAINRLVPLMILDDLASI